METAGEATVRVRAYDPATVEQFLAATSAERARLLDALQAAHERISAARRQLDEARATRVRLAEMAIVAEQHHSQQEAEAALAVERLLGAADADAALIRASAHAEAARQLLAESLRGAPEAPGGGSAEVIDLTNRRTLEVG